MSPFGHYTLHHVGIVYPDLTAAEEFMVQMELAEDYRGFVDRWCCWCIFTKPLVGPAIELVVPEGGPLVRFNRGAGGVHHYAYQVDDISETTAQFAQKGMKMIEPVAIKGAGNFLCNFISPIATRGIQIELVQPLEVQ
jgi:methylmalonyl-CoA/ethylmalonyl-CoA epimerase